MTTEGHISGVSALVVGDETTVVASAAKYFGSWTRERTTHLLVLPSERSQSSRSGTSPKREVSVDSTFATTPGKLLT